MSEYTNRLTEMIKEVPDLSEALASSISSVESEVNDLTKERDAIKFGVCENAEEQLRDYLENTKKAEVGGDTVTYGPNFGTINFSTGGITDWTIDSTAVPVYSYLGVGWDGDATITELITDYAFGNDYITRPLTSGATYGLNPNITSLNDAIDILNENKDKVDDSLDIFSRYAT